jgi:hypothetical protein
MKAATTATTHGVARARIRARRTPAAGDRSRVLDLPQITITTLTSGARERTRREEDIVRPADERGMANLGVWWPRPRARPYGVLDL